MYSGKDPERPDDGWMLYSEDGVPEDEKVDAR
jgi:hypothetical protein